MQAWDDLELSVDKIGVSVSSSDRDEVRYFLNVIGDKFDLPLAEYRDIDYAIVESRYAGSKFSKKFGYRLQLGKHNFFLQIHLRDGPMELLSESLEPPQKDFSLLPLHLDFYYELALIAKRRGWRPFKGGGGFIRFQANTETASDL